MAKDTRSRIYALYGRRPMKESIVRRSMDDIAKELARRFAERQKRRAEISNVMRIAYAPLIEAVRKDPRSKEAARAMQAIRKRRPKKRVVPKPQRVTERFFSGSFGVNIVPPFDYQWTFQFNGFEGEKPPSLYTSADRGSGKITCGFSVGPDPDTPSTGGGSAAVGTWFTAGPQPGITLAAANPSLYYNWDDWGFFGVSTSSSGYFGLLIGSYDLDGNFTGWVIDQRQNYLWDDESSWFHAGDEYSTPNYPLGYWFWMEPNHDYIVWVICGGDVHCDSGVLNPNSEAGCRIEATVPGIFWWTTANFGGH